MVANTGIPNRELPWEEWQTQNFEWRGWHRVALALTDLGLDMNDPKCNPLVETIRTWAEWNAELHKVQGFTHQTLTDFDLEEVAEAMEALKD